MSKSGANKKDTVLVPEIVEPVLSRRHEAVIVALLANPKIADAAKAAGVNESTIWRLMQNEAFQKRYELARDEAFTSALGSLQGAAVEAVATLQRNMTCGTPAAEVQASKVLLDYSLRVREQFGMEARIKQLEATLKAREAADKDEEK